MPPPDLFRRPRGVAAFVGLGLYLAALLGVVLFDRSDDDAWYLHLALLFAPSVLAGAVLRELAFLGPPLAFAGLNAMYGLGAPNIDLFTDALWAIAAVVITACQLAAVGAGIGAGLGGRAAKRRFQRRAT